MSYKTKSFLYFASLIIMAVTYYNVAYTNQVPTNEMASADIDNVSTLKNLN